ncbi:MAG: substrate-binding periplasmic protein, partial [Parvibaculaceae bacterium]
MGFAKLLQTAAVASALLFSTSAATMAAGTDVPASGQSAKIDAIKERGVLKVAAIGEFPWLPENTTGSGPQFSGPAWMLAEEYAKRLGVKLEVVPVSHETKVPILATGEADISIAPLAVTPKRQEVANFVVYSRSSLCLFGLKDNPKLADVKTVDDLNREGLTMAYFTGTPPETWAPTRFPKATLKGVAGSGANAPIEEIMAKRADFA